MLSNKSRQNTYMPVGPQIFNPVQIRELSLIMTGKGGGSLAAGAEIFSSKFVGV